MFDCDAVTTNIQVAANFGDLLDPTAPDSDGNLPGNAFTPTDCQQIVQVSAQYKWPVFTNYSAPLLDGGDFALLQVVSVTRTEPYC